MALRTLSGVRIISPKCTRFASDMEGYKRRQREVAMEMYKEMAEEKKADDPNKPGLGIRYYNILHREYDFSILGLRRWLLRKLDEYRIKTQSYDMKRHSILGPDLATAHFVTARNGKVTFKGMPVVFDDNKKLPQRMNRKYLVETINATGCDFIYEAFDNFIQLDHVKEMNFSANPLIDVWTCDKLSRIFRNSKTLEILNFTDCVNLTETAVEALVYIPSLRQLIIKNTKASNFDHIELLVHLFQDVNPNCEIIY